MLVYFRMEKKPERKPRNYSNGKIYCIRNHIDEHIYIGSTCQSLSKRMAYHRQDAKKENRQTTLIYPCQNMELKTVTLNCLKNALVKIQTHLRKEKVN